MKKEVKGKMTEENRNKGGFRVLLKKKGYRDEGIKRERSRGSEVKIFE